MDTTCGEIHGGETTRHLHADARPCRCARQINEAELRRFVSWLIASGVHGLYPNGSTGEFTRFNEEERRRIVRITCDETRGRVPILAGAAEANVKETLAACEAYAAMGARAVAIVSPIYYRLSPESVYAYFAEIARHTPIDITLYNIPMFASPIDVPTIRRLAADFPRVIGIKDSSGDLAFMMRMIAAIRPIRPDFTFLTGWEAVLAPMLMVGCDGGTNATSNAVPEVTRRIYDLCRAGNYDRRPCSGTTASSSCSTPCSSPSSFPTGSAPPPSCAASISAPDACRKPARRRPTAPKWPKCCNASWPISNWSPARREGCAPRTGQPAPGKDKLEQVVFEVMHELQKRGIF
jgi:dihydrodipicolinate synthase/N-acetylneuraminate lyase